MKFNCTVIVDKPLEMVAGYFADPAYLGEYQEGFISKELLEGNPGEEGSKSLFTYKQGKGVMKLTETIVENDLPHKFVGHYHHTHMDNTMICRFTALDENRTQYDTEIHYTAFRGFLPKIMAWLFPGLFKKQVMKWLENFKEFVEKQSEY